MKDQVSEYVPGVCNLGSAETTARIIVGIAGAVVTALLAVGLIVLEVPSFWRVMVFLPAMMGALGFVQAFSRFCVAYGLLGIFNVGLSRGKHDTVEQAEFRKLDRHQAWKLIALATVIAAAVTACVVVFP